MRAAVETAYRAALGRRRGRVWVAIDARQAPSWGRGKLGRSRKGWAGAYGRSLRGYRPFLAVDTATGQVLTYVPARGRARDADPWRCSPAAAAGSWAGAHPGPIREPRAFRVSAVEGLGTFTIEAHGLVITPLRPATPPSPAVPPPQRLPRSRITVLFAAPGQTVRSTLATIQVEEVAGALVIVQIGRVRIRRTPLQNG